MIPQMSKIIIDNRSKLSDSDALHYVIDVIREGRISCNGDQYCYLTSWNTVKGKIWVSTDLNKKSDRFVIVDEK